MQSPSSHCDVTSVHFNSRSRKHAHRGASRLLHWAKNQATKPTTRISWKWVREGHLVWMPFVVALLTNCTREGVVCTHLSGKPGLVGRKWRLYRSVPGGVRCNFLVDSVSWLSGAAHRTVFARSFLVGPRKGARQKGRQPREKCCWR